MGEFGLFWEMGTGKSTTAIAILRAWYNSNKRIMPTLIVSPVATLDNWKNEFKINSPERVVDQCQIVYGKGEKRVKQVLNSDKSIFITNPETMTMPAVIAAFKKRALECVVVDEADCFKDPKSKRLKYLLELTDKAKHKGILTGTPILNTYLDLWALFRILNPNVFGRNYFHFRECYFRDDNLVWKDKALASGGAIRYFPKFVPRPDTDARLTSLIESHCSRLKKEDCLDLPELIQMVEHVELSLDQRRAYDEMETELIAEVDSGVVTATNALTRVLRLLQIVSGYARIEDSETPDVSFKNSPRLKRLRELLEQLTPQNKVVVWCTFNENYVSIRALLKELEIPFAELTGHTKDRQAEIDRFNKDPLCRVMVSNPAAGGVGVNLTADDSLASYLIYYSRSYSLRHRLQSLSRTHRGGAEKYAHVTAIDLVSKGTIEEDVLNSLNNKEEFAEVILQKIRLRKAIACAIAE